jgi:hypothetical protein
VAQGQGTAAACRSRARRGRGLGFAGLGCRYRGARDASCPGAAAPWVPRPMGLGGPGGRPSAGAGGPERVGPSGSARSSRMGFVFSNLFLMQKQFQKSLKIV